MQSLQRHGHRGWVGKKGGRRSGRKGGIELPQFGYTSQMQKVWEVSPILWSPSSVLADTSFMASKLDLVLKAFVAANRPLVRLLIETNPAKGG